MTFTRAKRLATMVYRVNCTVQKAGSKCFRKNEKGGKGLTPSHIKLSDITINIRIEIS